ncbi:MAG: hypothetical protein HY897_14465 [Deltaproteobacteria bacterium]|nr:hypothetical protein [Deltaproteobacteria bacterium]
MYKHWAVVIALGAMMMAATLWTSCGDDEGADTGVADTGGGGGKDVGGGGTPDSGGVEPGPCDDVETGTECEGGYCVGTKCYETCDAVGEDCAAGACYFLDIDQFVCAKAGEKTAGEECDEGFVNDCEAGTACVDMDGGGTSYCFIVCEDTCDAGECTDTEGGFFVCVE